MGIIKSYRVSMDAVEEIEHEESRGVLAEMLFEHREHAERLISLRQARAEAERRYDIFRAFAAEFGAHCLSEDSKTVSYAVSKKLADCCEAIIEHYVKYSRAAKRGEK